MNRTLIVAKIAPGSEEQVAEIFSRSDRTDLPTVAGVTHRSLYRLGDVYVHLLETREVGPASVEAARRHPEFVEVSRRLEDHIVPYLPTWSSPSDAMARCFYSWAPDRPDDLDGGR